jgi:hypothetical protein
MAMKITSIKESTTNHPTATALMTSKVATASATAVWAYGMVATGNIPVTCIVTRHFRDLTKPDHAALTRTFLCMSDPTGNWSVNIGDLPEGKYMLVIGAEGEGIDCVELDVAGKPALKFLLGISSTTSSSSAITVTGSVLYYPESVHCSLCQIDVNGNPIGSPVFKTVNASSGKIWTVTFYPSDLSLAVFKGLYQFSATAYEGSASELIPV